MIKNIRLINFKSHKDTTLDLGNLTVLCGQNGTGKSSFLQSMLLLRQSKEKNMLNNMLDLNEPLCYLGKVKDVFYQFADKNEFEDKISIMFKDLRGREFSWIFDTSKPNITFLDRIVTPSGNNGFEDLSLFTNDFQYISAARNSETIYPDDYAVLRNRQLSKKEGKGELTAQFLYQYGGIQKVITNLKHELESDDFLLKQVSAWEREISKGVNIIPQPEGNSYVVKYSFDTEITPTDEYSSKNVGFGLSYSLPVITAILSAKEGSLLLIENPEAHIHPYGQSKLAELMCVAAQSGIQLIVETHSDHIINGILVQSKRYEDEKIGINREKIKLYHFDRNDNQHATISTEIKVEEGGRIKSRPLGFFDQLGKDLRKLI